MSNLYVDALRALCAREGGYKVVAERIGCNPMSLYQIVRTNLPLGEKQKGVGNRIRSLLDGGYPDWLNAMRVSADNSDGGESSDHLIPMYQHPQRDINMRSDGGDVRGMRVTDQWLKYNAARVLNKTSLAIVTANGTSMEPRFKAGDPLLIDTSIKTVLEDGVYFFRLSNEGFVRLLQRIPNQSGLIMLRAKSFNSTFDSFDINPASPDFEVLGRVVKAWKSEEI